jgi:hypothetical protein
MNRLIYAYLVADKGDEHKALIQAESIRTFAGKLAAAPIWVFLPNTVDHLSDHSRQRLNTLEVDLHTFEIDPQTAKFPFAGKVITSAAAETQAQGKTSLLVWMDCGSMVIREPRELLLDQDKVLGCRPVDHLLIGPPYDKPLDPFWEKIYADCGVDQDALFPMTTSTDQIEMYPYINAGMLVVRPEREILRTWRDTFLEIYLQPRYQDFYQGNRLYQIFIHQAVLAGSVLANLPQGEIIEFSHLVNYPLHMHTQYPADRRPQSLNELVSFRYEEFFADPNWQELIRVVEPLKSWLAERVKRFDNG